MCQYSVMSMFLLALFVSEMRINIKVNELRKIGKNGSQKKKKMSYILHCSQPFTRVLKFFA